MNLDVEKWTESLKRPEKGYNGQNKGRNLIAFFLFFLAGGTSNDKCFDTYHGLNAFSESETAAVRDFVLGLNGTVKYFNNQHSFSQLILLPWGFTSDPPENSFELVRMYVYWFSIGRVSIEYKILMALYKIFKPSRQMWLRGLSFVQWWGVGKPNTIIDVDIW